MEDILGLNNSSTTQSIPVPSSTGQLDAMLLESLETTEVQERDQEIQKIAENINELANIFQDLAVLVIDQGTILDRIDYNLENVQIKTEKGLNELIIADNYAENSKSFRCIMILLGIIVIEALILIVKNS